MLKNTQIQFDFEAVQFHNTTHENEVSGYKMANLINNLSVLEVFESSPDRSFTPYEVNDVLESKKIKMLQSSVKRAITDLTSAGKLMNTGIKKMERYNRPNYTWILNPLNK